ncbi:protein phosphatase PHLPP-like protein [Coccinella septempunctata]|uniref:protein phosphatase PHLPP-like protein n=1 Tax=Coccinella septempunctata TaxID=41139 RepID=UPI001D086896|nr:protein phosphatase PHLPP-like protein [Coccinella septempunctata]
MLVHAKKPLRFSSQVTTFPLIEEQENIELDSLENGEDGNHSQDDEKDAELPRDTDQKNLKYLNLNNLCKNSHQISECYVEEIVLARESIKSLADVQVLSLRSNGIHNFPTSVLQLTALTVLDISDNELLTLPPEINQLKSLQELVLDQNLLSVLPTTIWDLKKLDVLKVACNRITVPPDKQLDMRSLVFTDAEQKIENSWKNNGISTLNLRSNRLKGNIILGNYGNLIELDVSENNIEHLDLSALEQLQTVQCSRNSLTQLIIHGKQLTSLIAGNNKLKSLAVTFPPSNLRHIDVSYNDLDSLPEWLSGCSDIRCIFASNNNLQTLPEHLFCNEMPYLHTLQLAYNQLQMLPTIQRKLPIQEMFLQNNSLSNLPKTLFRYIPDMKVLNLSNNRLCDLPIPDSVLLLEKLFLTANCLIDRSLEKMTPFLTNIRMLHAAYNNFTSLPESCVLYWTEIEEIVLSGNKLLKLPNEIEKLKHLTVLRVHSNLLQNIPKLSSLTSLRVLDLAHNQLDRIDLTDLIPPNLKFLDLSCNTKLHVDSHQFNTYRTQRPMSLVDVSGKNRTTLPLTPSPFCENDLTEYSWSVGFSETSGCKQKLYISQIRLPAFCNTEALFGMFDGENNSSVPVGVDKVVPRILLEERTVKETAVDYMKYTMLSAHRELKDKGQKQGLNAVIVHILKTKQTPEYSFCGGPKKYIMKIASVGDIKLVLGRASGPVKLLPVKQRKQIRTNPQLPYTVPDPDLTDVFLDEEYEYMIIANKTLWEVISPENAIREVTLQRNVILAAKRLQDLAQSYGAEENLSIIVVKFNILSTDVDLLMRELRQTFRKSKYQSESGFSSSTTCQPGCCCEALNNECVTCIGKVLNEDRSSPSGQSDHNCSDCNSSAKLFISQLNKQSDSSGRSVRSVTPSIFESIGVKASPERRSYRGVAKALRARREEERNKDDSDSALSEEQFKCWEYMLEQNTHILFDKELNTLKKKGKKSQLAPKTSQLSRSNPLLTEQTTSNNSSGGFLSRQFGSARSFNPLVSRSPSRFTLDKKLLGGPHAAYFGSLQRLMPYNLEYDFAVMHERGLADSLDLDRMQQYWGVTTTEL